MKLKRRRVIMILLAILASETLTMYSTTQVMMMIDEPEKPIPVDKNGRRVHHTALRDQYKYQSMTEEQKRLYDLEMELTRKKLNQGDMRIRELRDILEGVKVYKTATQLRKKRKKTDSLKLVKYNADLVAEIQRRVKRDGKKMNKGKCLKDLIKEKGKVKNPFKNMVEVQDVIDRAQEPVKARRKKENKEIKEMLKARGLKELLKAKNERIRHERGKL